MHTCKLRSANRQTDVIELVDFRGNSFVVIEAREGRWGFRMTRGIGR